MVIHRTSIGCYERTLALLIEKYAGALPTWIAPVQVKLLAMTDRTHEHTLRLQRQLEQAGFRVESDLRTRRSDLRSVRRRYRRSRICSSSAIRKLKAEPWPYARERAATSEPCLLRSLLKGSAPKWMRARTTSFVWIGAMRQNRDRSLLPHGCKFMLWKAGAHRIGLSCSLLESIVERWQRSRAFFL